jgi:hypothetical protein
MQKEVRTKLVVKPYTNKQLAPMFERSERQWRREIAKVKHLLGSRPQNGHLWSIDQVILIFEIFGRPYEIIDHIVIEEKENELRSKLAEQQSIKKAG